MASNIIIINLIISIGEYSHVFSFNLLSVSTSISVFISLLFHIIIFCTHQDAPHCINSGIRNIQIIKGTVTHFNQFFFQYFITQNVSRKNQLRFAKFTNKFKNDPLGRALEPLKGSGKGAPTCLMTSQFSANYVFICPI